MDVEANIPEISIKANRPPINPPFSLSKLDFMRRISRKNVVALREVILMKARGAKGFNNINFFYIYYSKKKFLKLLKKKTQKESFKIQIKKYELFIPQYQIC